MSSAFAHMTTGLAGGIPSGMGMPPPPAAYNAALSHSQSYAGSSAAATAANTDPLYSPAAIDEFHRWLLQWKHVSTQYELVLSALRKRCVVIIYILYIFTIPTNTYVIYIIRATAN